MLNEPKNLWRFYLLSGTLILLVASLLLWPDIISEPTGLVTSRAYVYYVNPANCSVPLEEGWNLFSTPCYDSDKSVSVMLSDISGLYNSIHTYDAFDSSDPWKAYNPSLPSWVVQDLTTIDETRGYWINMKLSTDLDIIGQKSPVYLIQLKQGWNLAGYPTFTARPVNQSLQQLYPYWAVIEYYNATEDLYRIFYNSTQTGTFTKTVPYFGYWIYMTEPAVWRVT